MSKVALSAKPTRWQYQVMIGLAKGHSHVEIAHECGIATSTMVSYLKHIRNKFLLYGTRQIRRLVFTEEWLRYEVMPYDEIEPVKIKIEERGF